MLTHNWTLKDIRVGNVSAPPGAAPKDEPTAYHAPQLVRTLMDGPGNRSSITGCSCGGSFDGVYEYIGHTRRMCDWYARHAGIAGGGAAVAVILRQYDEAHDVVDYPDHPRARGEILVNPEEILDRLRREP